MRRTGNIYSKIISIENLKQADKRARRGKLKQKGVKIHLENEEQNILHLNNILINGEYKTSHYNDFEIFEPKHRVISRLPYYP